MDDFTDDMIVKSSKTLNDNNALLSQLLFTSRTASPSNEYLQSMF